MIILQKSRINSFFNQLTFRFYVLVFLLLQVLIKTIIIPTISVITLYIQNRICLAFSSITSVGKIAAKPFAIPCTISPDNKRSPDASLTHEKKYEYPIAFCEFSKILSF